jgi:hypothetical protein
MRIMLEKLYNRFKRWFVRYPLVRDYRIRRMTDGDLEQRRRMAQQAIKLIISGGDPYGTVDKYRAQSRRLLAEIRRRRNGPKPATTKIMANVGRLAGKGKKI